MKNRKIGLVEVVIIGLLAIVYLWLRLPDFAEKMTFHFDQGIHLGESWQMIADKKIRLIGPMIGSKMFLDRGFFLGPQYYYILALLGVIFAWDPLSISLCLMFIEMAVFGIFSYWIWKKWGRLEGMMVAIFLTLSPYLIIHSRFVWNPHMALWLGLFITMLYIKLIKVDSKMGWFVMGILVGIVFSLHFTMGIWLIPISMLVLKKWRLIKVWWWLLPGGIIGNLPWFIFELRHNFYNTITFFWVMENSSTRSRLEAHYLFNPFLGLILLGTVLVLHKIKNNYRKILLISGLLILSYIGQTQLYKNETIPLGMPAGWNYPVQMKVVERILSQGCPKNYNVATTNTGITRAFDLRYLLTIRGCPPMGVEEYPKAETLFLIAPTARLPEIETVWEVSSLGKFKVKDKLILNQETIYYELGF